MYLTQDIWVQMFPSQKLQYLAFSERQTVCNTPGCSTQPVLGALCTTPGQQGAATVTTCGLGLTQSQSRQRLQERAVSPVTTFFLMSSSGMTSSGAVGWKVPSTLNLTLLFKTRIQLPTPSSVLHTKYLKKQEVLNLWIEDTPTRKAFPGMWELQANQHLLSRQHKWKICLKEPKNWTWHLRLFTHIALTLKRYQHQDANTWGTYNFVHPQCWSHFSCRHKNTGPFASRSILVLLAWHLGFSSSYAFP